MRLIDADALNIRDVSTDYNSKVMGVTESDIDDTLTINAIPIPEDATNGDVIKAMFPNGKIIKTEDGDCGYEIYLDDTYSFCSWFDGLWWNAPYKAESEAAEQ